MFNTIYSHNRKRSKSFATINTKESMTQQSDAAETDINVIMARYSKTGQLPVVQMEPLYADFSNAIDYRAAVELIRAADEAFANVPAKIRREFDNDPQAFINFMADEKNVEKMREWGLTNPEKPKETTLTDVAGEIGKLRDVLQPNQGANNGTQRQ